MEEQTNGKVAGKIVPAGKSLFRDGHKSKLSPARQEIICDGLREGQSIGACAALAGISRRTLTHWLERGRREDADYSEFYTAVCVAIAEFEKEAVSAIVKAGKKGSWQAYMTLLERKHPETWGRRTVTRHEGHEGGPINFSLNLSIDDRQIIETEDDEEQDVMTAADFEVIDDD